MLPWIPETYAEGRFPIRPRSRLPAKSSPLGQPADSTAVDDRLQTNRALMSRPGKFGTAHAGGPKADDQPGGCYTRNQTGGWMVMHWLPRLGARVTILGSVALLCFSVLTSGALAGTAISTTTPFSFTGTNDCVVPAEELLGTGNVHVVITGNLSAGGMVQSHIQANFQGMRATAMVTGKKYQVPDSETQSLEFDSIDAMPFHETFEVMLQFVRAGEDGVPLVPGEGDDFYMHILAHSTVNANGIVTVQDVTANVRCQ